jgi:hemolysin activation/secretion protein
MSIARAAHCAIGWVAVTIAALSGSVAMAQAPAPASVVPPAAVSDPATPQRIERQQIDRLREEQRLQQTPLRPDMSQPAAPAAQGAGASRDKNIPVRSFAVPPSAILSANDIARVLKPFEGQTLSLADLFEAVAAINKLYDARNMPTARAYLPQQDVAQGVVRIQLIEAKVGAVKTGSSAQVSDAFILDRVGQTAGAVFSSQKLEQDLIRFNRLHEVQLRAAVRAGAAAGTTDVELEPVEPRRLQVSSFIDNAGRGTTGEERLGLSARVLGLTGHGDNLGLSVSGGRGSESYGLTYSVPINRDDLRLDFSLSSGRIKVVNGAFVALDIGGRSRELSLGLTKPVWVDATNLWNVYARLARKTSVSDFGGVAQSPVEGLVLSAGLSVERQSQAGAWTLDVGANQGLREWEGQSEFTTLRASASWLWRLSPATQVVVRGSAQHSQTQIVPSGEQFSVGGSSTVRGYPEGLLSGRNGYLTSVEWRHAVHNSADGRATGAVALAPDVRLTALAFIDHGAAFPYRPAPLLDATPDDFLTGAGFGVLADIGQNTALRLTLGWPLRDNPADAQPRRPVVNFQLTVHFN